MFDRVLNTPLDNTSRLIQQMWKPSVFIVLPIIQNQSKAKTIPHTVSETFVNGNSRYKIQRDITKTLKVGKS